MTALFGPLSDPPGRSVHAGSSTCPLPGFRAAITPPPDPVQGGLFRLDPFDFGRCEVRENEQRMETHLALRRTNSFRTALLNGDSRFVEFSTHDR